MSIKKLIFGLMASALVVTSLPGNINSAQAYPTTFVYEAEDMLHAVGGPDHFGSPTIGVMRAEPKHDDQGYMVYGPYTNEQLADKTYRATFKLRLLGETNQAAAQLEVYNFGGNILNDRKVYQSDFTAINQWAEIPLEFTKPNTGVMEYRVYFYDEVGVEVDSITVEEVTPSNNKVYESENLRRQIGSVIDDVTASNAKAVKALASEGAGYMQYGPYSVEQQINNTFKATYRLKVADNTSSSIVARIDAANAWGTGEWTKRELKGTDFIAPDTWQEFSIYHQRINQGSMEYRVEVYGLTDVTADNVVVEKVTASTNSYESEDLFSTIGSVISDNDASNNQARKALSSQTGYVQYGPYTVEQAPNNNYVAVFRLRVNKNNPNVPVARIEALNHGGSGDWRSKTIYSNDFIAANKYQDFDLNFTRTTDGTMEFRVYNFGNDKDINLRVDKVDVFKNNTTDWMYEAENSFGVTGNIALDVTASNNKVREATVTSNNAGYMVYGPYGDDQPADNIYTAKFRLKTRNNSIDAPVATIDVHNNGGPSTFVWKDIKGTDFSANNEWQEFDLNFNRLPGGNMEFRVWFHDLADVLVDKIDIVPFDDASVVYQAEDMFMKDGVSEIVDDVDAINGQAVMSSADNVICDTFANYCFVVFGPYSVDQGVGNYEATFRIKHGPVTTGGALARIEADNNGGSGDYVVRDINQIDFGTEYTDVTLNFYRTGEGNMEYRVFTYNNADIYVDQITVNRI